MGNLFEEVKKIVRGIHKAKDVYDEVKQRNQKHVKVFESECGGERTNMFIKNGELDGPGRISGRCGYKKDHARTFCCEGCYEEGCY